MKILVIDDCPFQREAAQKLLTDHEVTVSSGWHNTIHLLHDGEKENPEGFDVVLTDLLMPGEPHEINRECDDIGKPVPYGFNIAFLALRCGVPNVAIVSNGQDMESNHHQHPILRACDTLFGKIIPGLWFFSGCHCPYLSPEEVTRMGLAYKPYGERDGTIKNWGMILRAVTGGDPKEETYENWSYFLSEWWAEMLRGQIRTAEYHKTFS